MMKKCSVVLADEPTGSLDKKNRDIVMRLLHELNEEGKTVIIVTHDQGIIEDEPYFLKIKLFFFLIFFCGICLNKRKTKTVYFLFFFKLKTCFFFFFIYII